MRGVVYYNKGSACLSRLAVSIHTLKKHWNGPIALIQEGPLDSWITEYLDSNKITVKLIDNEIQEEYRDHPPILRKSQLIKYVPYELSLFMDSDTCVVGRLDDIFPLIEEYEFCTSIYPLKTTKNGKTPNRITVYKSICPERIKPAFDYGQAINTGVMGFKKSSIHNNNFWKEWEQLSICTWEKKLSITIEESAAQIVIPSHRHCLIPSKWCSIASKREFSSSVESDLRIIHYNSKSHISKHSASEIWKQCFWNLYFISNKTFMENIILNDKKLSRYFSSSNKHKSLNIKEAIMMLYLQKR